MYSLYKSREKKGLKKRERKAHELSENNLTEQKGDTNICISMSI